MIQSRRQLVAVRLRPCIPGIAETAPSHLSRIFLDLFQSGTRAVFRSPFVLSETEPNIDIVALTRNGGEGLQV